MHSRRENTAVEARREGTTGRGRGDGPARRQVGRLTGVLSIARAAHASQRATPTALKGAGALEHVVQRAHHAGKVHRACRWGGNGASWAADEARCTAWTLSLGPPSLEPSQTGHDSQCSARRGTTGRPGQARWHGQPAFADEQRAAQARSRAAPCSPHPRRRR